MDVKQHNTSYMWHIFNWLNSYVATKVRLQQPWEPHVGMWHYGVIEGTMKVTDDMFDGLTWMCWSGSHQIFSLSLLKLKCSGGHDPNWIISSNMLRCDFMGQERTMKATDEKRRSNECWCRNHSRGSSLFLYCLPTVQELHLVKAWCTWV